MYFCVSVICATVDDDCYISKEQFSEKVDTFLKSLDKELKYYLHTIDLQKVNKGLTKSFHVQTASSDSNKVYISVYKLYM